MTFPVVNELPRELEAVTADTFLDGLSDLDVRTPGPTAAAGTRAGQRQRPARTQTLTAAGRNE